MEAIRLRSKLAKVILCERRRQRKGSKSSGAGSRLKASAYIGGDGK